MSAQTYFSFIPDKNPKSAWLSLLLLFAALMMGGFSILFPPLVFAAIGALALSFLTRIYASAPTTKSRKFLYLAAMAFAVGLSVYLLSLGFLPGLGVGCFIGFAAISYLCISYFLKRPWKTDPKQALISKIPSTIAALMLIGFSVGFFLMSFSGLAPLSALLVPVGIAAAIGLLGLWIFAIIAVSCKPELILSNEDNAVMAQADMEEVVALGISPSESTRLTAGSYRITGEQKNLSPPGGQPDSKYETRSPNTKRRKKQKNRPGSFFTGSISSPPRTFGQVTPRKIIDSSILNYQGGATLP